MEEQTKKGVPGFVPLIALGVAIVAIVLYAFLPALSIDGRDYVGWMVTFYYWGHQYIYHYHEFGFNLVLSLATVLMNKYSTTMSSIFGFGEMQVTQLAAIAPNLTGFVIQ